MTLVVTDVETADQVTRAGETVPDVGVTSEDVMEGTVPLVEVAVVPPVFGADVMPDVPLGNVKVVPPVPSPVEIGAVPPGPVLGGVEVTPVPGAVPEGPVPDGRVLVPVLTPVPGAVPDGLVPVPVLVPVLTPVPGAVPVLPPLPIGPIAVEFVKLEEEKGTPVLVLLCGKMPVLLAPVEIAHAVPVPTPELHTPVAWTPVPVAPEPTRVVPEARVRAKIGCLASAKSAETYRAATKSE